MVHREAKTFAHRSAAITWARHREVQLEDNAELGKAIQSSQQGEVDLTLAGLIRWYIDTFESISKWQRSKQTHLEFLERHPFSVNVALRLMCRNSSITSKRVVLTVPGLRRFATTWSG